MHGKAEEWERAHASKFASIKYHLIHFRRRHRHVKLSHEIDSQVSLLIKRVEIKSNKKCRLLEVVLNESLNETAQTRKIRAKTTSMLINFQFIAEFT